MGPSITGWPGMRGKATGMRARETWSVKARWMAVAMRVSVGVGVVVGCGEGRTCKAKGRGRAWV